MPLEGGQKLQTVQTITNDLSQKVLDYIVQQQGLSGGACTLAKKFMVVAIFILAVLASFALLVYGYLAAIPLARESDYFSKETLRLIELPRMFAQIVGVEAWNDLKQFVLEPLLEAFSSRSTIEDLKEKYAASGSWFDYRNIVYAEEESKYKFAKGTGGYIVTIIGLTSTLLIPRLYTAALALDSVMFKLCYNEPLTNSDIERLQQKSTDAVLKGVAELLRQQGPPQLQDIGGPTILTLGQIEAQLPRSKPSSKDRSDLDRARALYGPNLRGLTLGLAQSILGSTVHAIIAGDDALLAETQEDKMDSIQTLKVTGFTSQGNADSKRALPRPNDDICFLLNNSGPFLSSECIGGLYGVKGFQDTSEVCELLFVFATK